ncbi:hypothetical protein [Chelativorans sp. ZYF759]|uniref:hypothetical protein n=1 Tax=Chelativorans sp. ZYF759 TaxID=2692213 RepID=UPI001AEE9674|nr:hypothetical protein [Chelativorans sp. ZYF759]
MLASLIASMASGEIMDAMRRAKAAAMAYLLAGVIALIGIGFLIAAGFSWLASIYGTVYTALGFGGGFILLAIIIIVAHRMGERTQKVVAQQRRAHDFKAMAQTAAMIVVPALIARGGVGGVATPLLALLGYGIYRENRPRKGSRRRPRYPDSPG